MKPGGLSRLKAISLSLGLLLFFALMFVLAMLLHGFDYLPWHQAQQLLTLGLLFALLGAYYGNICAFDASAGFVKTDRPVTRCLVGGGLAGLMAALIANSGMSSALDLQTYLLAISIGALFGWWGWGWARFIDF